MRVSKSATGFPSGLACRSNNFIACTETLPPLLPFRKRTSSPNWAGVARAKSLSVGALGRPLGEESAFAQPENWTKTPRRKTAYRLHRLMEGKPSGIRESG